MASDSTTPGDNMVSSEGGAAAPRPLAVVRAMIDALDRDLLQILARRMALVGEVAAW